MTHNSEDRAADHFDLERFVSAQADDYTTALAELRAGQKRSHWMWYIFPQFAGLGFSEMSQRYAIRSIDEARAYLKHPLLGTRLTECCEAVLASSGRSAHDIFGSPDDLKLRSSATLFAAAAGANSVFGRLLDRFFEGKQDATTQKLMNRINPG